MLLKDIEKLIVAQTVVEAKQDDLDIQTAFASDLISQVLATCTRGALWVTGLADIQSVNIADLFDLAAIVFVEDNKPCERVIQLARDEKITLLTTGLTMFEVCGRLYSQGLVSAKRVE